MNIYISYNKTLLLYHLVFSAKYRKKVFDKSVDNILKEISCVYEINFIEIGNDEDCFYDFYLSFVLSKHLF